MKISHSTQKPSKPTSKLAHGCFALFSIPFASVGLVMSFIVLRNLWTWATVQQWVETPATLLKAEAELHRGDDSDSYKAVARYRYTVAGREYVSDRVAIHGGADNVGDYQLEKGRLLAEKFDAGESIPCYVDPDDPARAILFRDLRPGLVVFKMAFATIFGAIGYGMLGATWYDYRSEQSRRRLSAQFPDKPWKWRPEWNQRRIPAKNRSMLAIAVGIALFWNLLSVSAFAAAVISGEPNWWQTLLIGIFPAIGLTLATWAGKLWLRRMRWGESSLELAASPGVIGGPLAGFIRVPARIEPAGGFDLRLECIQQVEKVGSDGDPTTDSQTIWERENWITRELFDRSGDQTIIPVQFLVPYSQPPSAADVEWRLTVAAKTTGVDYHAQFDVPVFKTDASSPSVDGTEPSTNKTEQATEFASSLGRIGAVLTEDRPDRATIYFPRARNRGATIGFVIFAVIWDVVAYALYRGAAPWYVAAIIAGIGVLISLAALQNLLERSNITFGGSGVTIERGSLWLSRTEIPPADIFDFLVEDSGLEVNGHRYKQVTLVSSGAAKRVLAKHIRRQVDAHRLADELKRRTGLAGQPTGDSRAISLESELPDELR